jgi:L-threonylcarbamoyladenylate synthase
MDDPCITIRVDSRAPDPEIIRAGAATIHSGGVVIYPTQCLYGLGVDAFNESAIDCIFDIKRRPGQKPLLILIPDKRFLSRLTDHIPPAAKKLIKAFWPGSLTLIFKAGAAVSEKLTAGTGKIGVRLPGHPIARQLVQAAARPITGTSANLSGAPGCRNFHDIPLSVIGRANFAMDAGPLKGGPGSTVVDITVNPPQILRVGIIPAESIVKAL